MHLAGALFCLAGCIGSVYTLVTGNGSIPINMMLVVVGLMCTTIGNMQRR